MKLLITGGTGTLGHALTEYYLNVKRIEKIYILSRNELKQSQMKEKFDENKKISFLIGDVRDKDRLQRAFKGIDWVIHAAAQKQVPSCEYNPFEAVQTNINGSRNVVEAAIDQGVKKLIGISTDKAVQPTNLYGSTKMCMEKIFLCGNAYDGKRNTKISIARYGNVFNSNGSVVDVFKQFAVKGLPLPITHPDMTRFIIRKHEASQFVNMCLTTMYGCEIFIPKLPTLKILDLANKFSKDHKIIGIREGEKIHETLVSKHEKVIEKVAHYIIRPRYIFFNHKETENSKFIGDYSSDNKEWEIDVNDLL